MYILSVTFVVEPYADTNFRVYFRDEIKPMVEGRSITFCRVLSEKHEWHFTYSLQIPLEGLVEHSEIKDKVESGLVKYNFAQSVLYFATLLKKEEF